MNSNKKRRKYNKYVLSRGDSDVYVVTVKELKELSRQEALSKCAITWMDLHRLLRVNAVVGEDLYIHKGKTKIKIVDGMMSALSKLETLHPSIIDQVKKLNLSHNGFKVHGC